MVGPVRGCLVLCSCALLTTLGCSSASSQPPDDPATVTVGSAPLAADTDRGEPATAPPGTRPEAPKGYVELEVGGVVTIDGAHAVILVDQARETAVPIFIGGTEALSIDLRYNKKRFTRPLTHDLFDSALEELGGALTKIQIDAIRDSTFIGSIYVRGSDSVVRLDARPSDAIALAIGNEAPIFVAIEVVDEAGIKKEDVLTPKAGPPPKQPESI